MVVATGEGGAAAESGQVGVGDVLHEINNESVCFPPPQYTVVLQYSSASCRVEVLYHG